MSAQPEQMTLSNSNPNPNSLTNEDRQIGVLLGWSRSVKLSFVREQGRY